MQMNLSERVKFATLVGLMAAACLVPAPAHAWLKICNKTSIRVQAAIGYFGLKGWTSEGWFRMDPRRCHIPIRKPLEKRYYYVLAKNREKGYTAGGINGFCTRAEDFRIEGTHLCKKRGYSKEWLGEIDKGKHANCSVDFIDDTQVLEFGTFGYVAHDGDGKLLPESKPAGVEGRY